MKYYISKTLKGEFNETIEKVISALKVEGFGILTDADMKATLTSKLGVEFPNYRILGACNPALAHKALSSESRIGTMLPCNVVVQELPNGDIDVAAVDPEASMQAVENDALGELAGNVKIQLERVIASL